MVSWRVSRMSTRYYYTVALLLAVAITAGPYGPAQSQPTEDGIVAAARSGSDIDWP